jgi:hypothetical protein
MAMSLTAHLPEELADRLTAEAARRGVSVDEVAAEALAARYPRAGSDPSYDALEAFIGGDSESSEPFDIHKARAEMAECKLAEGI